MTNPALYDIIRTPVITEKSTMLGSENKYTFKVRVDSDKPTIKKAVEQLFNVKVVGVNVINMKGKVKRFKGKLGKRAAFKKAIVTLEEGQTIDLMGGV